MSPISSAVEKGPTEKRGMERWLIAVGGGWGVRDCMLTEHSAEGWRKMKANWEHAPAIKMRYADFIKLTDEEIEKHWAYKMMRAATRLTAQLDESLNPNGEQTP